MRSWLGGGTESLGSVGRGGEGDHVNEPHTHTHAPTHTHTRKREYTHAHTHTHTQQKTKVPRVGFCPDQISKEASLINAR
jgi:hypothetical protein